MSGKTTEIRLNEWAAPADASASGVMAARTEAAVFLKYLYAFTVTSANATAGAVYSNNENQFTVVATIAGGTTLVLTTASSIAPLASGTLTKVSGTGDATIAFSDPGTQKITQPDYPRVLSITGTGSDHDATGNVVFTITDIEDNITTDTITLNSNTTVPGTKAAKSIVSIDYSGATGLDANAGIEVGTTVKLGLDAHCDEYSFTGLTGVDSFSYDPVVLSKNFVTLAASLNGSTNQSVAFFPNTFPIYGRPWG